MEKANYRLNAKFTSPKPTAKTYTDHAQNTCTRYGHELKVIIDFILSDLIRRVVHKRNGYATETVGVKQTTANLELVGYVEDPT